MRVDPPVRRGLALVCILVAASVAGGLLSEAVFEAPEAGRHPGAEAMLGRIVVATGIVYALFMAIPFVPGVEIGLGLIAAFGESIVHFVYACTLAGLTIAFLVGRTIPTSLLVRGLSALSLRRAASLVRSLEPMPRHERLAFLAERGPSRIAPFLLRHRYLALGLLLNAPGNIVLGGGGGLAMVAGISRLFSPPAFLLTIAIATAPVPAAVLLFDALPVRL